MAKSNASVSDTTDRLVVRSTVTVRSQSGMGAGSLLWIQGARVLVEVDHELFEGSQIDVKVDLSPVPGTALLTARVARSAPAATREMARYLLELIEVAKDDRQRWGTWLAAKVSGGTLSNLSDVKERGAGLDGGYVQQAERERRAAVERLSRGTGSVSGGSGPRSTPSGSPPTPSVASGGGTAPRSGSDSWTNSDIREVGSGRAAMREALKAAIKRTFDDTPVPEFEGLRTTPTGTTFSHRVTIPPSQKPLMEGMRPARRDSLPPEPMPARAVPNATLPPIRTPVLQTAKPVATRLQPATPTDAQLDDRRWTLSEFRGNSYLDVVWHSDDAFAFDAFGQVLACALTLYTREKPLPSRPPIFMVLRHATMVVQCEAAVLEHATDRATYRLQLNAGQIAEIRRCAKPGSVANGATDPRRRR